MVKNFTFCPARISNHSKVPEDIESLSEEIDFDHDFFADLFESNWEIFGVQILCLVVTFVLILPLTVCFIEVLKLKISVYHDFYNPLFWFSLQFEIYYNRNGTLLTQLNCTLAKVIEP